MELCFFLFYRTFHKKDFFTGCFRSISKMVSGKALLNELIYYFVKTSPNNSPTKNTLTTPKRNKRINEVMIKTF